MKLVIPFSGDLHIQDARLVRLTEFLGGQCELLRLQKGETLSPDFLETHVEGKDCCFVINPPAIREFLSNDFFPSDLASFLTSRFPFLLVHNLSFDPLAISTLRTLSSGCLNSMRAVESSGLGYAIASGDKNICGAFSGLNFGPVNQANDRVFVESHGNAIVRSYIAIGGQPFFASVSHNGAQVFFLAGDHLVDLSAKVSQRPLAEYFSLLIPPTMFIRYAFGAQCWRPNKHHATLIIDDPLLTRDYGFLNYERLLALMDKHNFHTSIAFIPYNYRRNSAGISRMFRDRTDRFSICFHGNDHTQAEFASKDSALLNAMLRVAKERMDVNQKKTGIQCDNVMVFPQGDFSREAMSALKAHNFSAAVNSDTDPRGEGTSISFSDLIEPSVLKFGGFSLFLRKYVREIQVQDIAFNLFFGKPIFVVEHHEFFKDPECLTQLVSQINALAPELHWSNLQTAVENSYLSRQTDDGTLHVRAYANAGNVENTSENLLRFSIEWQGCNKIPVETVHFNQLTASDVRMDDQRIQLSFVVPPKESRKFSIIYRNDFELSDANRRVRWKAKVFLRRRLSEIRDNYFSKNRHLLLAAKALKNQFFM